MKDKERVKRGKKARQSGARFERKVYSDLIRRGWNVSKFQGNVDLQLPEGMSALVPAKGNRFGARSLGFPDFICWNVCFEMDKIKYKQCREAQIQWDFGFNKWVKNKINANNKLVYDVIGVEAKSNGYLDRIEKAKCEWLLKHKVFSKILVAKKTKVGRKIVPKYIDFKEKYLKK